MHTVRERLLALPALFFAVLSLTLAGGLSACWTARSCKEVVRLTFAWPLVRLRFT